MNAVKSAKAFLLSRESEKGQILYIALVYMIVLLIGIGALIDLARWNASSKIAETAARAACEDAVDAAWLGGNAQTTFSTVMLANGIPTENFSPKEGTGASLKKGLEPQSDGSYRAADSWTEPTSFLQILWIRLFGVLGKARCVAGNTGGAPIAVRESAVAYSLANPGAAYTILGRDPKWKLADVESGTNFRGAVYVHMWCEPSSDPNCPNQQIFWPLTSVPPSPATEKQLAQDCFSGINCGIDVPIGTRLPIVGGTSDAMLCKSFQNAYKVNDYVKVVVFNGTVENPDPTYGNWENVRVIYYAIYQIASFEPNANNCNHVKAKLVGGPYTSEDQIPENFLLQTREISWDYQGVLP